jgi:hypothetical protein
MNIIQKIILVLWALALILFTSDASEVAFTINDTHTPYPNPIKPPESISTNYLVAVGQYEVGFNIASPYFFEKGYRTIYNSDNLLPREDYNLYATSLVDDSDKSCIFIEVREFKYSVSKNAQNLESDTIDAYAQFIPNTQERTSGDGLCVVNYDSPGYHGYHGIIIDWPSDKTEIVIHGYLISRENWRDIWESVNLSKKPAK